MEDDGGSTPPGVSTPHLPGSADHTAPTADSGADDPTAEEDPPPLPPPLMDDSALVSESADQGTDVSPHQVTSDSGAGDPTYAPVLARTQNHVKVFCVSADRSTLTLPTADNGTTERPAEEYPPPLPPRLMGDDASVSESADKGTPCQVTSDNGDPTYTPVLTTTPNAVSQPAATEKVSYEDIQKYQNEQVHVWFSTHLQMHAWLCDCHVVSCLSSHVFFFPFMLIGPALCLTTIEGC